METVVTGDPRTAAPDSVMSQRVLLVGASGYLGRHIGVCLDARGHEVIIGDPRSELADLGDPVDVVVNAAGAGMSSDVPGTTAVEMLSANVGVAIWCVRAGSILGARVVHLGTLAESRGSPEFDAYRDTKRLGTEAVRLARSVDGLDAVILRPSLIYGGGGRGVVEAMAREIAIGRPFKLRQPDRRRDLIHVSDVASAVVKAVESPEVRCPEIEIGSGLSTKLSDVADSLAQRLEQPRGWVADDEGSQRADEDESVDTGPAKQFLSFEARVTLDEGLDLIAREARAERISRT